jgi:hypothetical protein
MDALSPVQVVWVMAARTVLILRRLLLLCFVRMNIRTADQALLLPGVDSQDHHQECRFAACIVNDAQEVSAA